MSQRRVVGKHLILGQLLFEGLVRDEEGRSCRDVSKRLLPVTSTGPTTRRTAEADTSYAPVDALESARVPEAC